MSMRLPHIPIEIPPDLAERSVPLAALGFDEVAWKKDDAQLILHLLRERGSVVLGGDVYLQRPDGKIDLAYANWSYAAQGGNDPERSIDAANEYIKNYPQPSGEKETPLFNLVIDDERVDQTS